jgi:hypothetical protein
MIEGEQATLILFVYFELIAWTWGSFNVITGMLLMLLQGFNVFSIFVCFPPLQL